MPSTDERRKLRRLIEAHFTRIDRAAMEGRIVSETRAINAELEAFRQEVASRAAPGELDRLEEMFGEIKAEVMRERAALALARSAAGEQSGVRINIVLSPLPAPTGGKWWLVSAIILLLVLIIV